ncbi:MAG: hypothetical protein KKD44_04010 [Proteobacteria bacterium]|nr:hypothetical protein [Pseudomonadota bacterium]
MNSNGVAVDNRVPVTVLRNILIAAYHHLIVNALWTGAFDFFKFRRIEFQIVGKYIMAK